MIKSYTAVTREIDSPKAAVADILASIPVTQLLKNTIGVISCFSEFEDTGVLKEVALALPFPTLGATTCICSAGGEVDQVMLSVTVLTSDDCFFETSLIELGANYQEDIQKAMKQNLSLHEEQPKVILSYFPLMNQVSGDMMIDAIDSVTDKIPLFGTTAVDHLMDYSSAKTILNGQCYREAIVLASVYGNCSVTFETASLDENKIRRQKAIITESNGNILIGVNGKPSVEYLAEIGVTKAELATGLGILPLVVDHKDGTKPVARAVFALTPDGSCVCGGAMPVNATLSIGRVDSEDVLQTTKAILTELIKEDGAILSYSCMARYLSLGANNEAEAQIVSEIASGRDYLFACSGGEICPSFDETGKYRNFYHNFTIAFCRIK